MSARMMITSLCLFLSIVTDSKMRITRASGVEGWGLVAGCMTSWRGIRPSLILLTSKKMRRRSSDESSSRMSKASYQKKHPFEVDYLALELLHHLPSEKAIGGRGKLYWNSDRARGKLRSWRHLCGNVGVVGWIWMALVPFAGRQTHEELASQREGCTGVRCAARFCFIVISIHIDESHIHYTVIHSTHTQRVVVYRQRWTEYVTTHSATNL